MLQGPGGFRILSQWKIAVFGVHHVVRFEPVVAHQVRCLVEPMLPECRCGPGVFQRSVADWAKGAEVRMVEAPADAESTDSVQQGLVGIGGSPNYELNGHPRRAAGMQRVFRPTVQLSLSLSHNQLSDPLEVV